MDVCSFREGQTVTQGGTHLCGLGVLFVLKHESAALLLVNSDTASPI